MPALGVAQDTGKLVRWLKAEGDEVAKGEPVMEVETDKVTVEVEAPADGLLGGVRATEGEDVPVGQVVAYVLAPGEEAPAEEQAAAPAAVAPAPASAHADGDGAAAPPPRRRLASPKARRIAQERGVDLERLSGSGPGGAIVAADLAEPSAARAPRVGRVWARMADHVTESWQTVPHFYLQRQVDASRLLAWRAHTVSRPGYERATLTDLLVKVSAEALARHPAINASWRDGSIVDNDRVNVGIAVAIDDGLMVPVVHDANRLKLRELVERRAQLVEAARSGALRPEDVSGGTFTISNLGARGAVDVFQPIVNAPQAAILAIGAVAERVIPVDGRPGIRPLATLSVAFDHRVVTGAIGADFLETLAALVEEPAGLVE